MLTSTFTQLLSSDALLVVVEVLFYVHRNRRFIFIFIFYVLSIQMSVWNPIAYQDEFTTIAFTLARGKKKKKKKKKK